MDRLHGRGDPSRLEFLGKQLLVEPSTRVRERPAAGASELVVAHSPAGLEIE